MNRELVIEYEVFEEEGEKVLSVVDQEKDEVINMFKGGIAEKLYRMLSGENMDESPVTDHNCIDDAIKAAMEKYREGIIGKLTYVAETEGLAKEAIVAIFDEIRELVNPFEKLALEGVEVAEQVAQETTECRVDRYKKAMDNTKYNEDGKAVIEAGDEWREEKEWDEIYAEMRKEVENAK